MWSIDNIFQKGKKVLISLGGVIVLLVVFRLFSFFSSSSDSDNSYVIDFLSSYKIFAVETPEDIRFCNEPVPLHDRNIRDRLDRELLSNTYYQSNTLLYIKRANRWFPIIEPILKKYGIPDDFKYLPLVESNLTNIISPAGATGYWQLMKATGKSYNLEINEQVDERYDMKLAAEAACKYLREAYSEFDNWTLAAAAYNRGIDGIKRQLKKQDTDNYYDLYLNTETSRYIFRLLAIKEIVSNPSKYGYHFREKDLYPNISTHIITVDTTISNLATFAKSLEINYRILKLHNPWLRRDNLPNKSRKAYNIIIPDSGYYVFTHIEKDSAKAIVDSSNVGLSNDSIAPADSSNKE